MVQVPSLTPRNSVQAPHSSMVARSYVGTLTQPWRGSRRQGRAFGTETLTSLCFGTKMGVVKELRVATRKHRIGIARIIAVMENADVVKPTMTKRGEPGTFYQGYDNRGREIELIVIEGEDYDLVVHAMPVDYRRRK